MNKKEQAAENRKLEKRMRKIRSQRIFRDALEIARDDKRKKRIAKEQPNAE